MEQAEIQILGQLLDSEFTGPCDQLAWRAPMRTTCTCAGLGFSRTKFEADASLAKGKNETMRTTDRGGTIGRKQR